MNKTVLFFALFVSGQVFAANSIECTASNITGPLEESFTEEEYPEVKATDTEASIGANNYDVASEDKIEIRETEETVTAYVTAANGSHRFEIVVNKGSKTGEVLYYTPDSEEGESLADLTCK